MPSSVPGFPEQFPVAGIGRRPLRYRLVSVVCHVVFRSFFGRRLRVEGVELLPAGGPLLIACNHLSNLDPLLLGGFCPGPNTAMAKRELFRNRLLTWILSGCNTFPVERGTADRWALRMAVRILRGGGRFILWVEGTRASKPGMNRAEPGVGFLLRQCNVPVAPCAMWGTEAVLGRGRRLPRRAPVTIRFGPPRTLEVRREHDSQEVADRVAAVVAALLPEEYRGVYAEAARQA